MTDVAPIVTQRLRLDALRPETLAALLDDDRQTATNAQGTEISEEFVEVLDRYFVEIQLERMNNNPEGRGWCARAITRDADGELIGHCGFHGPPEDVGRAEIGYTILERFRANGYATEAASALITYAAQHGATTVFATVAPGNAPSLRVVEKLGFMQTGVQIDDIDGEELVFEFPLPAAERHQSLS
jgi:RimJ/RimL family protein N-acetyltransferase